MKCGAPGTVVFFRDKRDFFEEKKCEKLIKYVLYHVNTGIFLEMDVWTPNRPPPRVKNVKI